MKLWVAVLASATLACGGKTDDSSGPVTPPPPPKGTTPSDAGPVSTRDDGSVAPPWTLNPGGTITFEPTLVSATRSPNTCGFDLPFSNGDLYSLDIGDRSVLTVSFGTPALPIGTPLMLSVQPFSQGTLTMPYTPQGAQGSGITFQYSQGDNAGEIDTGSFDAVTITILAMPTADGQPLTVRIQMHFVDGRSLDETFSSPLVSSYRSCVSG